MNKEFDFFVYLIESYSNYKNVSTSSVLDILKKNNLTQFIYNMYEIYHVEDLHNAFLDIDTLINNEK